MNLNFLVTISNNIKKLNIGINKAIDKTNIWASFKIIEDKLFLEKKPPAEITVKAKLNDSKSLMLKILKTKIRPIVKSR